MNESNGDTDRRIDGVMEIEKAPQLIRVTGVSLFFLSFEAKVSLCGDYSALN